MIMKGSACAHEQVMRKKAKASAKGGRGGAPKMLTKLEPVPSFFNFFSPPQVWHKCCATADVDSVLAWLAGLVRWLHITVVLLRQSS